MNDLSDFAVPHTFVCEKHPIGNSDCTDTCDYIRKYNLKAIPAGCVRPWWHSHSIHCIEIWLKAEAIHHTQLYSAQIERLRDHYGDFAGRAVDPWKHYVDMYLKNLK